jgi:tRNA pseudouridine38-40 synthase
LKRYRLLIEYDGGLFRGFQRLISRDSEAERPRRRGNPRLWPRQRTVQEELEVKLGVLLQEPVRCWGAGRTDQGVHATGQVVSFETGSLLTPEKMFRGLSALLDPAVKVVSLEPAGPGFHPRFSARRRLYHYYLLPSSGPSPFWSRLCWCYPGSLQVEAMQHAARPLLGSHDFSAYARQPEPGESRIRELLRIEIGRDLLSPRMALGPFGQIGGLICFEVEANAFLRRMVRQLVANLVKVGSGEWPLERPYAILKSGDAEQSAPPAPPQGLFLVSVDYPEEAGSC